jgi:hypothetical protein
MPSPRGSPDNPMAARHPTCQVTAQALHYDWRITGVDEIRLLVNPAPVGLQPSDPPHFEYSSLTAPMIVCDLIQPAGDAPPPG